MWRKLSQWIPFATDPPEEKDDEIIDSGRINQVLYQRNFELAVKNRHCHYSVNYMKFLI